MAEATKVKGAALMPVAIRENLPEPNDDGIYILRVSGLGEPTSVEVWANEDGNVSVLVRSMFAVVEMELSPDQATELAAFFTLALLEARAIADG